MEALFIIIGLGLTYWLAYTQGQRDIVSRIKIFKIEKVHTQIDVRNKYPYLQLRIDLLKNIPADAFEYWEVDDFRNPKIKYGVKLTIILPRNAKR